MMKYYILILLVSSFIISCDDDNSINQSGSEEPLYTHSLIELYGPGLQEYHDTVPLIITGTDSIYTEFWSETNIDTTDHLLLHVSVNDTLNGIHFSGNYFTEDPLSLNNVHGFGFKLIDDTLTLEIALIKGSIDNKFLRIRNLKICKK